jgi:hypothetical protein
MKKIFLFLVIFALSFGAKAQSWTPIFGKQRFASGLGIPTKDSTYFAGSADSSLIYINPKDAGLYYKYKGYHKKVGTGTVSSVGLTMPSAFSVSGSPITNNGSFIVTGAGSITQYIRGDGSLATLNTAAVPESGNLYYTDARARAAISGTSPISVTSGVVSISQSNGSTNGYLSATDWTVFNSKQTALNGTGFVKQSGTTTSYDNTTYYPASNPNGYTSNTGTVTSVALTAPSAFTVTGSPVTTSGTLALGAAGNSTQYIDGSGSLQTFPTMLSSDNLIKLVRNQSGATMTAGTIVYIDGATGNKPTIAKALATSDATSAQTYGAVQADIANNADGYIVVIGNINNLNTSGLTEGAQLYLSSTTAGTYTTTKQYAPAHLVYVGIVLRAHPTQGIIGVKIQNGYELDELHNVAAQTPSNNDGLFYESSTSLWKNKSIATVLGYTPEQPLTFSAPLSRSVNTVSIPAATGSVNGYLSSTDWTTFNGKQNAITLTTTGSSGSATFVSNTLNVPTYTLAGLGGQPQLNGTGFVKASGTTISYDNSTYLTTSLASSTYVPFTGATTDVILGPSKLKAFSVYAEGSGGFGGAMQIKQYATATINEAGYSSIGTLTNGIFYFASATTAPNFKNFALNPSGLTDNTLRTYTLPDASGTIALTSGLTGFVSGSGTSGQVPLFNGTQSVTNSQIYDNGNTVSIGNSVTSPNRLVSFSTNASGFAILGSGSGGAGGVYAAVTSGTGNMFQGSTSNGGYHIVDNAGNTYISGKVGIGTFSSSSYNLNVVGTGYFSGTLTAGGSSAITISSSDIYTPNANSEDDLLVNRFGYNGGTTQFRNFRVYDGKTNVIFRTFGSSGNVAIGSNTDAGYKLDVNGTFRSTSTEAVRYYIPGTPSNTLQAAGSPFIYFQGGGVSYTTIQQGVGKLLYWSFDGSSWNQTFTFDKSGDFSNTGNIYAGASFRTDGGTVKVGAGSNNYYSQISTAYNYPYVDSYFDAVAGASYEGKLNFRTSTGGGSLSTKMTILNSGNVGIGTTSPSYLLDVQSGSAPFLRLRHTGAGVGYYSQLLFETANTYSGTSQAYIRGVSTNAGNNDMSLVFATSSGVAAVSEKMRITETGTMINSGNRMQQLSFYGSSQRFVFQSAFDNPTATIFSWTDGGAYAQTMIKVTVIQNTVTGSTGNSSIWSEGYAMIANNPSGVVAQATVSSMVVKGSFGSPNVGTLSWDSSNNLRYTANRASNYDGYVVLVEYGSNTNQGYKPTLYVN